MKILIVTPFFPHSSVGHAGGKFIYEIVKALSQRHKIHLLSRIEPDQFVFIDEMKAFCTHIPSVYLLKLQKQGTFYRYFLL